MCKGLSSDFENNGLQKKVIASTWTENVSIQTKNCVAALSIMASIVLGSLVRQVCPHLLY